MSPSKLAFGAYYHLWNRGVNRTNIFITDDNYHYFLKLYQHHIVPVADTFAYTLLPNHFHLLVRTLSENEQHAKHTSEVSRTSEVANFALKQPSQAFSNFFNAYVKAFNNQHERTGGLFEGRLQRKQIRSRPNFVNVVTYIHRNPQSHGLVDDFRNWPFSSYPALDSTHPTQLRREALLRLFGNQDEFRAWHEKMPNKNTSEVFLNL